MKGVLVLCCFTGCVTTTPGNYQKTTVTVPVIDRIELEDGSLVIKHCNLAMDGYELTLRDCVTDRQPLPTPLTVSATLTEAQLLSTTPHRDKVDKCAADSKLSGPITMKFTINFAGQIVEIIDTGSKAAFPICVQAALRDVTFPITQSGAVITTSLELSAN